MNHPIHTSPLRSLAKAICWRAVGSLDTFILGWLVTHQLHVGFAIAGLELFTKTVLYYAHERAWTRVDWGIK